MASSARVSASGGLSQVRSSSATRVMRRSMGLHDGVDVGFELLGALLQPIELRLALRLGTIGVGLRQLGLILDPLQFARGLGKLLLIDAAVRARGLNARIHLAELGIEIAELDRNLVDLLVEILLLGRKV